MSYSSAQPSPPRFAIYVAPSAGTPLARFGASCLGRDAVSGEAVPQPALDGVTVDRWRALTASPRQYGFHATLKAPFRLTGGRSRPELIDRLQQFASSRRGFAAPPLRIARIADFLALVLSEPSPEMNGLADEVVRDFDEFRAPPTETELARREPAALSDRQRALLSGWGYPYVFDEWRFHMTLATGLVDGEDARLRSALEQLAPGLDSPLPVDAVCLFEQAGADQPFQMVARCPFDGSGT